MQCAPCRQEGPPPNASAKRRSIAKNVSPQAVLTDIKRYQAVPSGTITIFARFAGQKETVKPSNYLDLLGLGLTRGDFHPDFPTAKPTALPKCERTHASDVVKITTRQ